MILVEGVSYLVTRVTQHVHFFVDKLAISVWKLRHYLLTSPYIKPSHVLLLDFKSWNRRTSLNLWIPRALGNKVPMIKTLRALASKQSVVTTETSTTPIVLEAVCGASPAFEIHEVPKELNSCHNSWLLLEWVSMFYCQAAVRTKQP